MFERASRENHGGAVCCTTSAADAGESLPLSAELLPTDTLLHDIRRRGNLSERRGALHALFERYVTRSAAGGIMGCEV